jgi:hypothetical protein
MCVDRKHAPAAITRGSRQSIENDRINGKLVAATDEIGILRKRERFPHYSETSGCRLGRLDQQQAGCLDIATREQLVAQSRP